VSERLRLMGIVNVTPDSFSDGGRYLDRDAAVAHGLELAQEGAEILDIGGESTRPGAAPVGVAEELRRVVPVIEGLREAGVSATISIDSTKAEVVRVALDAGAGFVNDVSALRVAPEIGELVAESGAELCLMHMRGDPRTMQIGPTYEDVVSEVKAFLAGRMEFAIACGVSEERIVLDPGIGFGKTVEHNVRLLARLEEIAALGRPILVGASRKSFLGSITGRSVDERLPATIAANVLAYERGARLLRVHEVAPVRDAVAVAAATVAADRPRSSPGVAPEHHPARSRSAQQASGDRQMTPGDRPMNQEGVR
jgi:dihydropteroate synthase